MVYEITRHLLQKRGKRLRPVAVFLTARACGDWDFSGLDAAIAIELIHTATLLHDDVIDESELRRGQYSVNHKWNNTISVLMGDYLFAKAFKTLVQMKSAAMYSAISQATEKVSVGQLDEIREMRNFDLSEQSYFHIITNKTASLFAAACQAGGLCAVNGKEIEQDLRKFGEALGIAFQITDDLLDYVGSTQKVGKEVGKDLLEGKVTLPLIAALRQSQEPDRAELFDFLKNGFSKEGFPRVLEFVQKWRGVEYSRNKAIDFGQRAWSFLKELSDSPYKDSLKELVEFAVDRDK
jgi:octaprenyl-diphosphate synthase